MPISNPITGKPIIAAPVVAMPVGLPRPAGQGGGGGGGGNFYSTLFTSIAATAGFVFHGGPGKSSFYEDSAGTVFATTHNVSPVGHVTDLSGLNNHLIMPSSSSFKPVFKTNGTHRWYRSGYNGFNKYLQPTIDTYPANQETVAFLVIDRAEFTHNNYAIMMSQFNGNWVDGFYRISLKDYSTDPEYMASGSISGISVTGSGFNNPVLVVIRRWGLGTNQARITSYSLAGTVIQTALGTADGSPNSPIFLGYGAQLQSTDFDYAFAMHCNKDIGQENEDALVAEICTSFAGWTG